MKVNAGQAPSTLIPEYIGSDFDKVITVADNIEAVTEVVDNLDHIKTIENNLGIINTVSSNIEDVIAVGSNITDVKSVATNIDHIKTVESKLDDITIVADNIVDVVNVSDNMDYVKDVAQGIEGLPVISYIGDEPPTQPLNGAEWFCTKDGRTYTRYEDDDSGQWVESSPQSVVGVSNTFALWKRSLAEAGYDLIGSFQDGCTVTSVDQVVLDTDASAVYQWKGTIPAEGKVVPANSTPVTSGGVSPAAWVDRTDGALRSELAVVTSGVLIAGKPAASLVNSIENSGLRKIYLRDYCTLNGTDGDADGLESAIADAVAMYESSPSSGKVVIVVSGVLTVERTIKFNPAKISFCGPATIQTKSDGVYTSSRVFLVTDDGDDTQVEFAAYSNRQTDLFSGLIFVDKTNSLVLQHVYTVNTDGNNNPVALHTISSCTFRGFMSLFTHGRGAWGWTWKECGGVTCNEWMHITNEPDSYERHTFFGCMWHNGGTAFYINNPNGKVYWYGGSCDYSLGLANVVNGQMAFDGHIEFSNRTSPLVTVTSGHIKLSGALYIVTDSTNYSLVDQSADYQLDVSDLIVACDANSPNGRISNRRFSHRNVTLLTQTAETYFSSRLDYPEDMRFPVITTYGVGVSVVQTAAGIAITSTVGGGADKGVNIDIPINASKKIGWNILYANSGGYAFPITKSFLPANKSYSVEIAAGDALLQVTAQGFAGSILMQQLPAGSAYIRFTINLFGLGTSGSVYLADFGLFSY